jgi:hypothetical protein
MTDNNTTTRTSTTTCQTSCPCPVLLDIADSIASEENAIACILNAECAKINKVVTAYNDVNALTAVDTSVQETLEQIIALEGVLKLKLDSVLPLISECK